MQDIIYQATGLVLQVGIAVAIVAIIRGAVETVSFLRGVTTRLGKGADGMTGKARDRAHQTQFYQGKEFRRDFRKAERKRASNEAIAERMRDPGIRGAIARRRAAGFGNAAGQQRAYVQGIAARQKQDEEEISQANQVLQFAGVQGMPQLRAIAEGGTVNGVRGEGNRAVQRAAIRRIIAAQDSTSLEQMYASGRVDHKMLANEVREQFSTVKGAGAHLVDTATLATLDTGAAVSEASMDRTAVSALSALSPEKLAGQDGDSARAAARGFRDPTAGTPEERDALRKKAQKILSEPEILKGAKEKTIEALHEIAGVPYGPSGGPASVPNRGKWKPGEP